MFVNCKHCGSLVATDPATDQPPERCPRCRGVLRSASPPMSVASLLKTPTPVADVATTPSGTPDAPKSAAPEIPATGTPAEQPVLRETPASPRVVYEDNIATPAPADVPVDTGVVDDAVANVAGTTPIDPPAAVEAPLPAPVPRPAATRTSPSFARRGAPGPLDARMRRQHRILYGAVVALTLLLGLQVLLADRARLASDPGWRPTLARLCGALRCSLPPWREPAALTVLARDVRPDGARAGQLLATATFRNDARWAQAWPRLRLTLSDIDGRAVGTRVFTAQEYLQGAPSQPTLAAGDSADARLQLVEPDARAVSFAFDFL
ncbi:DUF3426 domain-containing protein [Luteimonas fraxinea]|uniref:DUF3426 domain-containing protein n=1 Tax=Luteimonas fraxinea TaxID=2901869 RepID=UPI001E43F468|nr:DUF3426 domain-containing protein [Luteimonas fraxinea]MCD9127400.1 DUF3426 domain-containing protein [Luteimonas fraxinea]